MPNMIASVPCVFRIAPGRRILVVASAILVLVLALLAIPAAQAQTYTDLHGFTGRVDGGLPYAGVTLAGPGRLYGAASEGGTAGYGLVFKLTQRGSAWILTPLYNFTGGNDGADPVSRVTVGPDGALYGTTAGGGGSGNLGTVFNLRPPAGVCRNTSCLWKETVMHRFAGGSDGAYTGYADDLVFDKAGNVYGTSAGDTNGDDGTIFELTPSNGGWTQTILYSFTHGEQPYAGVTFDSAGNLWGAATLGGTTGGSCAPSGCGFVYELTPSGSGWVEHNIYEFQGKTDGAYPIGGVIFDPAGNLYGSTSSNGGSVYELQPSNGGWIFSTLYAFAGYFGPVDTPAIDAAGNLYGTVLNELGNFGWVFKLTPSGGGWTETNLAVFGVGGPADGIFPYSGVVLDAGGNVYGTTIEGGAGGQGVVWEITQ